MFVTLKDKNVFIKRVIINVFLSCFYSLYVILGFIAV